MKAIGYWMISLTLLVSFNLRADTGNSDKVFSMADEFIRTGNYQAARTEYEKLKDFPGHGRELALFNIAESYRLEKDYSGAHRTYREIYGIPELTAYYRIYGLFREAEVYLEEKNFDAARRLYEEIVKTEGALQYHVFTAQLAIGDTYRAERKYSRARDIYENLLRKEEKSVFPNDGYRLNLKDRLEAIEGLKEGVEEKSLQQKRVEWVNSPKYGIYVSPNGSDNNPGTKEKPFLTVKRAQEEVRKIKSAKGMPEEGIVVYLRGGKYFLLESINFGKEDSGTDTAPVVYRSYPEEEVRIIGGRQVKNFNPLTDPDVIRRLPDESKNKVWVADLKEAGITVYGELLNRGGHGKSNPAALELFSQGSPMHLARWPNKGYERVAGLPAPDGEMSGRGKYQYGKFQYSGERPERWLEESDIWLHGFLYFPYAKEHVKVGKIDTENKTISLLNDIRWGPSYPLYKVMMGEKAPYFVYNLLSELDIPGEWYLDRDAGKLYFYPPESLDGSEAMVSTLNAPLVIMDNSSNIVLSGLTMEVTRRHGIEIRGGKNNFIAGSVIRNTGQWAVMIDNGWEHKVVGCDIYDTGEGGVFLTGGDRDKLIPARHTVENNHIYRFNRFDGGYRQAVSVDGIGQCVSHNVIHEAPMQALYVNANDHTIEFNEIHDVPYEGREIGAIYFYGSPWWLMNRGTVIRNNFFHHISTNSSPNRTHGLRAIHVDGMNAGIVFENNIFYRVAQGIASTYPGNWMTNNIFVDAEGISIWQSDRSYLFYKNRKIEDGPYMRVIERMVDILKTVRVKQPPWSLRYPPLVEMMEDEPVKWAPIQGSIIECNINTGGPSFSVSRAISASTVFQNNWDGEDPLFTDKEKMNFSIRPGSPVYGITGCEPVKTDKTGVYKDELRASWPIKRSMEDIGKYYRVEVKPVENVKKGEASSARISPALEYGIPYAKHPVTVDGRLDSEEWQGLGIDRALKIDRHWDGQPKESSKSYAWLLHDDKYLYIATKHEPEPFTADMPASKKNHVPLVEVSFESQAGTQSQGWWPEDMPTGPIYTFWGGAGGKLELKNRFEIPGNMVRKLEASIEYKTVISDRENFSWMSEMKIPFSEVGINLAGVNKLRFNMGVWKRAGWFAWVPTGSSIWLVENAGFIKFLE